MRATGGTTFARSIVPRVVATLRRRFVAATMDSALDAAAGEPVPGLAQALLAVAAVADVFAGVAASGLSVTALDPADGPLGTTTWRLRRHGGGGCGAITLGGYLRVPVTGTYEFGLTISDDGDTASLSIGDGADPLLDVTSPAQPGRVPIDLKAGALYPVTLDAHRAAGRAAEPLAGTVAVDVGDLIVDGSLVGPAPALDWRPRVAVDTFTSLHLATSKALLLAGRLRLSERELRQLTLREPELGALPAGPGGVLADDKAYSLLDHVALQEMLVDGSTSAAVRGLLSYVALRADIAGGNDELVGVLAVAATPGFTEDDVHKLLATLARRELATVKTISEHLGLSLSDLANVSGLRRLWDALVLVARLGVGAGAVIAAATPTPNPAVAGGLRDAVRASHDVDAWRVVATSVNNPLRRRRRDSLVTYLLHSLGLDPSRPELLYNHLLLDPGTEPVVQTSRLRLAISCVQLFIQRCLLNLERDVPQSAIDTTRWAWMKRYRVWEANRKIFLYPENWLDPELRDDRTHLYTALTGALLQGDITDRLAEDAFVTYLPGRGAKSFLLVMGGFRAVAAGRGR